ncbi:leucine zipper transcription factor-like protein 1 [Scylla paramamosain]
MSGVGELGLSEEHRASVSSYLRFNKYQRAQRLRSIEACFQDVKDTRLVEDTYTVEEVMELLDCLGDVVKAEVEGELLHACHTNSLLLTKLFKQAQKWHLTLSADTSDLENQELLEEIKNFEEKEGQHGRAGSIPSPKKRTLAPITEAEGPLALLQAEIQRLMRENADLSHRVQEAEKKVSEVAKGKTEASLNLVVAKDELNRIRQSLANRPTSEDVTELCNEVERMRMQLSNEIEAHEATQDQLAHDLSSSKQNLQQVKAQLQLAEKELEKKFSQTGAFQNMKKMLNKKNEQIKAMRKKLSAYEPNSEDGVDE